MKYRSLCGDSQEEANTYCGFEKGWKSGGAVVVRVNFLTPHVICAHVRVIQTVPVASCGVQTNIVESTSANDGKICV